MSRCYLIDTNGVVAGLLASQADSAPARVLDGMLQAVFPFVLSTLGRDCLLCGRPIPAINFSGTCLSCDPVWNG